MQNFNFWSIISLYIYTTYLLGSYGVLGIMVVEALLRENEAFKKFQNSKFVLGE